MKNKIVLFFLVFLIWCALDWPIASTPAGLSVDFQKIIVGLIVAAIIAFVAGDLFTNQPKLFLQPKRYLWLLYYIPLFIWECLKANVFIALRLIRPKVPMSPGIIKIKTSLKTDVALTYLANTLTMAREVITIDIDKKNSLIYLHGIDIKKNNETEIEKKAKKFEIVLKKIFE